MTTKWLQRLMVLARHIATWSKDPNTQVGAVIVDSTKRLLSTGYNGIPQGVFDNSPTRDERPTKYFYYEHAERNAIYTAGRNGTPLMNSTLVCTMFPCADCARAIIQSGITTLITTKLEAERWTESSSHALIMLTEANITITYTT
jgi:dCMP deaminase